MHAHTYNYVHVCIYTTSLILSPCRRIFQSIRTYSYMVWRYRTLTAYIGMTIKMAATGFALYYTPHTCIYTHMCTCTLHMRTHTEVNKRMHAHTTCIHTYACTHTHARTHTHTHTHYTSLYIMQKDQQCIMPAWVIGSKYLKLWLPIAI